MQYRTIAERRECHETVVAGTKVGMSAPGAKHLHQDGRVVAFPEFRQRGFHVIRHERSAPHRFAGGTLRHEVPRIMRVADGNVRPRW